MNQINSRITPSGEVETKFRREVRDALDLDIFTRDDQIVDEIRRLKRNEAEYAKACIGTTMLPERSAEQCARDEADLREFRTGVRQNY